MPTIPLNVIVTTGNLLRTLIVQWDPPSSPRQITTYMITYNEAVVDINNTDTSYTITGLDPYTNYSISVVACNVNGCGNQSDVVIGTTEEEGMLNFHTKLVSQHTITYSVTYIHSYLFLHLLT